MSNTLGYTNSTNNTKSSTATMYDATTGKTYNFPFNVNGVEWQYQMNNRSFDTIGGRVTQLVSVKISTMSIQGEAGSRVALLDMYTNMKAMQDSQNTHQQSMTLSIPVVTYSASTNLGFRVWVTQMQMGWDVSTVTYPYMLQLEVEQDFNAITAQTSTAAALDQIAAGIGFSPGWTGLSKAGLSINLDQITTLFPSLLTPTK